jgi:hypothetical protein
MSHQQPEPNPETSVDDEWAAMERWLIESMGNMPTGAVLDVGPAGARVDDDGVDVECVQIQALGADTYLIRLSTTVMSAPLLSSFVVSRDVLDLWFYDDTFADCTHGFLMSRSRGRVAEIAVAWFRDRCGFASPDDLGCSYEEPVRLPRSVARQSVVERQGYP